MINRKKINKITISNSNTHMISFLNDNDLLVSIESFTKSHQNIQLCFCVQISEPRQPTEMVISVNWIKSWW